MARTAGRCASCAPLSISSRSVSLVPCRVVVYNRDEASVFSVVTLEGFARGKDKASESSSVEGACVLIAPTAQASDTVLGAYG